MRRHRLRLDAVLLLVAGAMVAGCKPDYPSCETDKDCHAKEFCVANKCQQCRDTNDCPAGSACKAGKCESIPGYCSSKAQCPANQECIANRCRPVRPTRNAPAASTAWQGACYGEEAVQDRERLRRRTKTA